MKKKVLALILVLMIGMMGAVNVFATEGTIAVNMNGEALDMPAKVFDGELYLPLRAVAEKLGFNVQWSGASQEINVAKPDKSIRINITDSRISVNDHDTFIFGGLKFVSDRTYIGQSFFNDDLGLKITWDKTYDTVTLESIKENPVTISTREKTSESNTFKLTLQYPEITGLQDTDVQNKLNSLFAELAAESEKAGRELEKNLGQDELTRNIKTETYFNYQIKCDRDSLLSIVFSDYQYGGGAHGNTVQSSYTFDLDTGNVYKLSDLFSGSSYISTINSAIKKQIEERGMTATLAPFETIKADQDFYLSNNAVVVYFQAYEYWPYSFGIPEFSVDFPLLKEGMKPEFD